MQTALPICIEMIKQRCKITVKELYDHCIPTSYQDDRRQVPKDKRVLYQNRSCILNNAHAVQQYLYYENARALLPVSRKRGREEVIEAKEKRLEAKKLAQEAKETKKELKQAVKLDLSVF
jgi:hypothetical protein